MKARAVLIKGGRILDPSQPIDMRGDVLVVAGKVARAGSEVSAPEGCAVLDASEMIVCPGFIDLHCHLREPGFEEKETVASGTAAAARGGFTTICCMPNTEPPLDNAATIDYVTTKAQTEGLVRVLPIGCITRGRKGQQLAEMGEMARAGAVGFSDDGDPVLSSRIMRHALEYSLVFGLPVVDHCEDKSLSEGGVVNEGWTANRLGLRGVPSAAEENVVARDLALARYTGAHLHVAHVSTAGSVELIRRAKDKGIRVTAEAAPHHLTLTEERVMGPQWGAPDGPPPTLVSLPLSAYDTNTKVNPPLRTEEDRQALLAGLKDGAIDAIATDHAPHAWTDKACEFGQAAFGISGLETALAALMGLVRRGELDLGTLISKLTCEPARILGVRFSGLGTLLEGSVADLTVFDPEADWVVAESALASKGKNTPYMGATLRGKVMATLVGGKVVYLDGGLAVSAEL
ncbi:MAG: dihydroorotase [Chloroflexi bacterium]|nr:dihydroorotase [Chloroflexota bacterium]